MQIASVPIVINNCFGGFCLSSAALARLKSLKRRVPDYHREYRLRSDPDLVAVVCELGAAASDQHSSLIVIDVDKELWDGNMLTFDDHDGYESVRPASGAVYALLKEVRALRAQVAVLQSLT